jgi:pyruvate dehydrogenase E2 component (dihydrolipoamide acetyltransferase)
MAISVVMPALEMAQETGKLLAWRKKEGDKIVKGEPLLEIETDKATVEVEATAEGILAGISSKEGAVVTVGTVIAWILQPGESLPAQASGAAASAAPSARATTSHATTQTSVADSHALNRGSQAASAKISPKARRLAKENGIDIATLKGTGPEGTISTEDVLAAKSSPAGPTSATSPSATTTGAKELSAIARLMAERTTQSWTTVPHFFVVRETDAGALLDWQKKAKEKPAAGSNSPTVTDCLISLVARTLERHHALNSSWKNSTIHENPDINIGLAIAVPDGVVAPVIHKANLATLSEIATQRAALTDRSRNNRLQPADLAGGTFTISNLGMFKVDAFTAIIIPPQAAILAVGAISDRVVAVDGKPQVRPVLTLTLSSDHRVVDGAHAAAFLNDLVDAVGAPEKWLRP